MPRVTSKLYDFRFDKKSFLADVSLVIQAIMIEATGHFARAASSQVPVWTGMARGGFLGHAIAFNGRYRTAESYIGLTDSPTSIDISSQVKTKGWKLKRDSKGRFSNPNKDKDAGAAASYYEFRKTTAGLSVRFHQNIVQMRLFDEADEKPHNSKTAPWHSIAIGMATFQGYVNLPYNTKRIQGVKMENYVLTRVRTAKRTGQFVALNAKNKREIDKLSKNLQ